MSLLHGCIGLAGEISARLEVAHVDHGLRASSKSDAEIVARAADSAGLPFHLHVAIPPEKGNIEDWGRRVRYSFFRRVLEQRSLDWVVTAHTADDVAETLLMRLFSNKEPRTILAVDRVRRCLRPLLTVPKAVVERYASENSLVWTSDESNLDTDYLRNRVRHKVIPLLAADFDPRMVEVLSLRAAAIAEDIDCLYAMATPAAERLAPLPMGSKEWLTAIRAELAGLAHAPLQWRLVDLVLRPVLGFSLGRDRAEEAASFFAGAREKLELPGGVRLEKRESGVRFVKTNDVS